MLDEVWKHLEGNPTLGDVANVRRGEHIGIDGLDADGFVAAYAIALGGNEDPYDLYTVPELITGQIKCVGQVPNRLAARQWLRSNPRVVKTTSR